MDLSSILSPRHLSPTKAKKKALHISVKDLQVSIPLNARSRSSSGLIQSPRWQAFADTRMQNEIDDLKAKLDVKEERWRLTRKFQELQLAAKYGTILVGKVQSLEDEITALKASTTQLRQDHLNETKNLQASNNGLRARNDTLSRACEELTAELESKEASLAEIQSAAQTVENRRETFSKGRWSSSIEMVDNVRKDKVAELEETITGYKQKVESLQNALQAMKEERDKAKESEKHLESLAEQLRTAEKGVQQRLQQNLAKQTASLNKMTELYEQLCEENSQLEDAQSKSYGTIRDLHSKCECLAVENSRLRGQITNLKQQQLRSASTKSFPGTSLQEEISQSHAAEAQDTTLTEQSPGENIAADSPVEKSEAQGADSSLSNDVGKEFFHLTLLSAQLRMQLSDAVYSVSSEALYEEATREGIPFHEWDMWVTTKLNAIVAAEQVDLQSPRTRSQSSPSAYGEAGILEPGTEIEAKASVVEDFCYIDVIVHQPGPLGLDIRRDTNEGHIVVAGYTKKQSSAMINNGNAIKKVNSMLASLVWGQSDTPANTMVWKYGIVRKGDILIAINGKFISSKTFLETIEHLRNVRRPMTLTFQRNAFMPAK